MLATTPAQAGAQASPAQIATAIKSDANSRDGRAVYAARFHQPLWIRDGSIGAEADMLLQLIDTAELDGLDPDDYRPRQLRKAIERSEDGTPKSLAKAEILLSRSFAALARDMRRPREVGMIYADAHLAPGVPTLRAILEQAAAARSFTAYIEQLGWMNPIYARLRMAAIAGPGAANTRVSGDDSERDVIRVNLDRARALPADLGQRYVLVDVAAARLWMYKDGRVQDTMRVVVGKPSEQTPMMAALIRYANVNPYWNIPPDLVRLRVAPGALAQGPSFLKAKRYEVLSGWSPDAQVVSPATIDWAAVESGRVEARVRQLPGPHNAMGRIKFMFPNDLGIYLHDTPEKALLREDDRLFSSGCVRVEDAPRLARWLFGKPLAKQSNKPEQRVEMLDPVPVYITYFTATADKGRVVFHSDVYGRD